MAKKKTFASKLKEQEPDIRADQVSKKSAADLRAVQARYKEALGQISALETQLESLLALPTPKHRSHKVRLNKKSEGNAAAILVLCDWHCGQTVDPAMVLGINEFNPTIFRQRTKKLWVQTLKMLEFARGLANIDEFYVAILGDLIGGYIHPELEESNAMGPMEEIVAASECLVEGLDLLVDNCGCDSFSVKCCYGNHSRTTKEIRHATAYKTNLEWLMYKFLARDYASKGSHIDWEITPGPFIVAPVKGNSVRFQHGNLIKYQGGIGGVTIPANKAQGAWNRNLREPPQWDIVAHWHQFLRQEGMILCPCLIGYDAYAQSIKAQFEPPAQALLVFDKERGLVMAEKVFVD